MGNPGEELKPEPYILHEDTVRDPTGILRLIRQYHRENNFRAAMQWFEKLDRTLSQPGKPPPQQWSTLEDVWLEEGKLQLQLGQVVAILKLTTTGTQRQLIWRLYVIGDGQDDLSELEEKNSYCIGILNALDVPHYYSDREDDFWATGRDRVFTLMHAINESVKDE